MSNELGHYILGIRNCYHIPDLPSISIYSLYKCDSQLVRFFLDIEKHGIKLLRNHYLSLMITCKVFVNYRISQPTYYRNTLKPLVPYTAMTALFVKSYPRQTHQLKNT